MTPTPTTIPTTGIIEGRTTVDGTGVRNTTLTLYNSAGQQVASTTSNSTGYYRFEDVEVGSGYEIVAEFDPCVPQLCGPENCPFCFIENRCEIQGIRVRGGVTTVVNIEYSECIGSPP